MFTAYQELEIHKGINSQNNSFHTISVTISSWSLSCLISSSAEANSAELLEDIASEEFKEKRDEEILKWDLGS